MSWKENLNFEIIKTVYKQLNLRIKWDKNEIGVDSLKNYHKELIKKQ